jgi:hypothetical protein
MSHFFNKIKDYWENNGFEMLALICLVIILILCAYNMIFKNRGTYSEMALLKLKRNGIGNSIVVIVVIVVIEIEIIMVWSICNILLMIVDWNFRQNSI